MTPRIVIFSISTYTHVLWSCLLFSSIVLLSSSGLCQKKKKGTKTFCVFLNYSRLPNLPVPLQPARAIDFSSLQSLGILHRLTYSKKSRVAAKPVASRSCHPQLRSLNDRSHSTTQSQRFHSSKLATDDLCYCKTNKICEISGCGCKSRLLPFFDLTLDVYFHRSTFYCKYHNYIS